MISTRGAWALPEIKEERNLPAIKLQTDEKKTLSTAK
jgi:hypothetical protein